MKNLFQFLKSKKVLLLFAVFSLACLIYILIYSTKPAAPLIKPTSVYPPNGSSPLLMFPSTAVSFFFETPVKPNQFTLSINPQIETQTRISPDGLAIHFSPKGKWPTETTFTVTLKNSTGEVVAETSFTYLDPFKHPELLDDIPPGGI